MHEDIFFKEIENVCLKVESDYIKKIITPIPSFLGINGLNYIEKFLTQKEERLLTKLIDNEPWNTQLLRRTQHYGYVYDYSFKKAILPTKPIPTWCNFIITRLLNKNILLEVPDQMIVNEYHPGQGIHPHVDDAQSFNDGIVSISLGSDILMDLLFNKNISRKKEVLLHRRSALVFNGVARYDWRHGIAARKSDHGVARNRRISLTFRKIKNDNHKRIKQ